MTAGITLFDLNSKHGTAVNGTGIIKRMLQPDDMIRIGSAELRFEEAVGKVVVVQQAAPSGAPAPTPPPGGATPTPPQAVTPPPDGFATQEATPPPTPAQGPVAPGPDMARQVVPGMESRSMVFMDALRGESERVDDQFGASGIGLQKGMSSGISVTVTDAEGGPKTYPLGTEPTSIGSDSSCDIQLSGPEMQPNHAILQTRGVEIAMEPVGGAVVMVNDKLIQEKARLKVGDTLSIGGHLLLLHL